MLRQCGHAAARAADVHGWSDPGGRARPPARRSSTPRPSCSPRTATPTRRPADRRRRRGPAGVAVSPLRHQGRHPRRAAGRHRRRAAAAGRRADRRGGPAAAATARAGRRRRHQLCDSPWNLGALYLLPELRVDRFEQFRLRRANFASATECWRTAVIAECDGPVDADELPFRLVESVINRRSDDGVCPPEQPWVIADGALRTLGFRRRLRRAARRDCQATGVTHRRDDVTRPAIPFAP